MSARLRAAALAVLVLLLVGLAAWQAQQAGDLREAAARDDAAQAVAADMAGALLSYRHDGLEETREAVVALATDEFATAFAESFDGVMVGLIGDTGADSEATVRQVYLTATDGDTARAVVRLDATVTAPAGTRELTDVYLEMELLHLDGVWQVNAIDAVAASEG